MRRAHDSGRIPSTREGPAYTDRVSRLFWIGVGAAGGIVAYRKTTQTVQDVRQRSFRENLSKVARTATNVAASARYLAALSADEQTAEVVDIRRAPAARREQASPGN